MSTMTDKEGTLRLQPSGRWAIMRPGREPFELTSGDVFRVEVDGKPSFPACRLFKKIAARRSR